MVPKSAVETLLIQPSSRAGDICWCSASTCTRISCRKVQKALQRHCCKDHTVPSATCQDVAFKFSGNCLVSSGSTSDESQKSIARRLYLMNLYRICNTLALNLYYLHFIIVLGCKAPKATCFDSKLSKLLNDGIHIMPRCAEIFQKMKIVRENSCWLVFLSSSMAS